MRIQLVLLMLSASIATSDCAQTVPLSGGKSIIWTSCSDASKLVKNLGYEDNCPRVHRDTQGHMAFVDFREGGTFNHPNHSAPFMAVLVSERGVITKELPGQSCLNDQGQPVLWRSRSTGRLEFASGFVSPTNVSTMSFICDGRYVALFATNRGWIATVDDPMHALVPNIDPDRIQLEKIVSHGDTLNLFAKGQPEGQPRPDHWPVLKRFEYHVASGKATLVQIQDFRYTWQVFDFDPDLNLLLVRSWDDMFAHAWLVNVRTGERKSLPLPGDPIILKDEVIQQYIKVLNGN